MRFHLFATIMVIGAAAFFQIEKWEWCVVLLCCGLVISLELLNTAIEVFADKIHPEYDKAIGLVKDIAAGATLVVSVFAAVVGLVVFVPYLFQWLEVL